MNIFVFWLDFRKLMKIDKLKYYYYNIDIDRQVKIKILFVKWL